jgi:hypothetical protein
MAAATSADTRNLLAPESVTRLRTHVQELRTNVWEITMGNAVPAFVHANGPAKVTNYNFLLVKGARLESQLVTRCPVDRSGSEFQDKHDLADLFDLTPLGKSWLKVKPNKQVRARPLHTIARPTVGCMSQLPNPDPNQVYAITLCCSGQAHGRSRCGENDATNCLRLCGGHGECVEGCAFSNRAGHRCAVRLLITATLQSLSRSKVLVTFVGLHVPAGSTPVPPAQNALRMASSVKRELVALCMDGKTASAVVGKLQKELKVARTMAEEEGGSSPSIFNSRWNPPARSVTSVVEAHKSEERGGREDATLGDWPRSCLFVTRVALPRGLVLYYKPMTATSGLVVLATEASLCLAREFGQLTAAMDCKHDTTRDCRSMYSSMRVPSPWGWFLVAVWLSSVENTATIEVALRAIADNVPCSDPACRHTVSGRWEDGIYRRRRCCVRTFKPHIGTDKHNPSYTAINAAGYGGAVLDPFHGYRAFDERLLVVGIREGAAAAAAAAFRLWTRSETEAKAQIMRAEFIAFVLGQCQTQPPLWSMEQAVDLLQYFDSCWHLPEHWRTSWIDELRLSLLAQGRAMGLGLGLRMGLRLWMELGLGRWARASFYDYGSD